MNKPALLSLVLLFSFLLISQVSAEPSIGSVSGTLAHGQAITISGSGFGVKDPAAPLLWDDGEDKTADSPGTVISEGGYSEIWPFTGTSDSHLMQYRNIPYRNLPGPHSRSTKYLAGGHEDSGVCSGGKPARNVCVTMAAESASPVWWASWYVRLDPDFPYDPDRYKYWTMQDALAAYGGNSIGTECKEYYGDNLEATLNGLILYGGNQYYADADFGPYQFDIHKEGDYSSSAIEGRRANEAVDWVKMEVLVAKNHVGEFGERGYADWSSVGNHWAFYIGNPTHVPNWQLDINDWNPLSFTVGGYFRREFCDGESGYWLDNNAFRFFDDIYIDTSLARVILGNAPNYDDITIMEPQIPSAWSDGSITAEVNLGALPDTGTAYLFVFNEDNEGTPVGFPVSLQGGGEQACPDSVCNGTETCYSCPQDCGQCCPNAQCEPAYGETCSSCPQDCPTESDEVCCSGVLYTGDCCSDSDCTSPETCTNHACTPPCENDVDGDDYGIGANCLGPDCDDSNPNIHQNTTCPYNGLQCGSFSLCLESCPTPPSEICDNSLDDDCDGQIDCNDGDCYGNPNCPTMTCDSLALLMHFDNNPAYGETPSHIYDFSGNGNNASCSACPEWNSSGRFSGAFQFDGSSFLDIEDSASIDIESEITLAAWVYYETPVTSWPMVLGKGAGDSYTFQISHLDNRMGFWGEIGGSSIDDLSGGAVPLGEWSHIAVRYNRSRVSYFLNGIETAGGVAASGDIGTNSNNLYIGRTYGRSYYFTGLIDELAIWDRALSNQKIQDLYISNSPINCGPVTYHRADTNQDDCISLQELLVFVDRWKVSRQDVPMTEMMGAVGLWKSGAGC